MFTIRPDHVDQLAKKDIFDRRISNQDTFFIKKDAGYKSLYNAVMPLDVMLDKFDFGRSNDFPQQKEVQQLQTVDKRYFKPELSTKNKIGQIFAKKI